MRVYRFSIASSRTRKRARTRKASVPADDNNVACQILPVVYRAVRKHFRNHLMYSINVVPS
eukprot:COSAG02_NODE_4817_length_4938_cov_1.919248_3_plen_61_part_00